MEVAQGQQRRILQPNEQARLSANVGIAVQAIDSAQVNGWLDGWLRFRNAPLGQVVAEANRYSPRKLRLDDPKLAGLQLNGNFHTGDSAFIASAVAQILPGEWMTAGPISCCWQNNTGIAFSSLGADSGEGWIFIPTRTEAVVVVIWQVRHCWQANSTASWECPLSTRPVDD